MDQFRGGKEVTVQLARLPGLTPGLRVLDWAAAWERQHAHEQSRSAVKSQ